MARNFAREFDFFGRKRYYYRHLCCNPLERNQLTFLFASSPGGNCCRDNVILPGYQKRPRQPKESLTFLFVQTDTHPRYLRDSGQLKAMIQSPGKVSQRAKRHVSSAAEHLRDERLAFPQLGREISSRDAASFHHVAQRFSHFQQKTFLRQHPLLMGFLSELLEYGFLLHSSTLY